MHRSGDSLLLEICFLIYALAYTENTKNWEQSGLSSIQPIATSVTYSILAGNPLLKTIFSYNQITDLSPIAFLPDLEILDLEHNLIESGRISRWVYLQSEVTTKHVPDGLGVRIPGFHPGGPGSIPGLGALFTI